MELYFTPMACSLATRIAFYEAGATATYTEVDSKTKRTGSGDDYREINPLGLVPALRTDDGEVLTENAAILQYVAARFPEARLAPADGMQRTRLQQWLCFIGTELHKGIFGALLDKKAPEEVKRYALDKGVSRLHYLEAHLKDREYLLDRFSVADAYLAVVLGWTVVTPIMLGDWPALSAYLTRVRARPAVAKALDEEFKLYQAELARHRAA
jgi:glutathione S-transferase